MIFSLKETSNLKQITIQKKIPNNKEGVLINADIPITKKEKKVLTYY